MSMVIFDRVTADIEDDKFGTDHLPTAVDLGGDWNDAVELQEEATQLRRDQVLASLIEVESMPDADFD